MTSAKPNPIAAANEKNTLSKKPVDCLQLISAAPSTAQFVVGGWVSGEKAAYRYLPASVIDFPGKKEWMEIMSGCGYSRVMHRAFTFGMCRMYIGEKEK